MATKTIDVFQDDLIYSTQDPALTQIGTPSTLRFWRHVGRGPNYIKISEGQRGRVGYHGRDLNAYLAERRVKVSA